MKLTKVLMVCAAVTALVGFAGCSSDSGDGGSGETLTPWEKANKNSEITVNGNTYSIDHSISAKLSDTRCSDTYVKNIKTEAYGLKGTITVEEQQDKNYFEEEEYGAGFAGIIFDLYERSTGKVSFGMLRVLKNSTDTNNWKIQVMVCKGIDVDNFQKFFSLGATKKDSEDDLYTAAATSNDSFYYCYEKDVEAKTGSSANGIGTVNFEISQITDKSNSNFGGFKIIVKDSGDNELVNTELKSKSFGYQNYNSAEHFVKKYAVIEGVFSTRYKKYTNSYKANVTITDFTTELESE